MPISFNPTLPTLCKPVDNYSTTLTSAHTSGSGTLVVASVSGLGTPTTNSPIRITVIRDSDNARCHFKVTNVSGNTLTVAAIDGYSDINFAIGDNVGSLISAGTINDIHTAIADSQPTISWISLANDIQIPSDATITGVGSSSFSDAGYGTLTLTSGPYSGQTVTQAIQHVLDLAATSPIGIIWDVKCSVGVQAVPGNSGNQLLSALVLRRPGNLHIVGRPGCGAILRPQTNATIFANESPTFGTLVSASGTDQQINSIGGISFGNVVFENLYLNANSGVATTEAGSPNQTNPTFNQNYYLNIMRLFGVQDIHFRNCQFVGAAGYHLWFGNWQRIRMDECTINSQGAGVNTNGNNCIHLASPGDDFLSYGLWLSCEDDHIAINNSDVSNSSGDLGGPSLPVWGSLTRVRAYDTIFMGNTGAGSCFGIRPNAGCLNTGHVFDGMRGTVQKLGVIIPSATSGATLGPVGTLDLKNIDIDFSAFGLYSGASSSLAIERISLSGVKRSGSNLAIPLFNSNAATQDLVLDDIFVFDDGTSASGKVNVKLASGAAVSRLTAEKCQLIGHSGNQTMPLVEVDSGASVGILKLHDLSSDHVLDLATNAGTVTTLLCSKLSMTNFGSGAVIANPGTLTNYVLSNSDPEITVSTGTSPSTLTGDFFGFGAPTISISPTSLTSSLTGQTLTVSGTDFTTATTFTVSGLSGTSITNTVINSRISATLTLTTGSTTGTATIHCSDFATASLAVAASGPTVYLDDTFTGTAGASLTGEQATPTNNGSDVYTDLAGFGYGVLGYAPGGVGATSLGLGGSDGAFARYPLTGVPQDGTYTLKFTSSSQFPQISFHLHSDAGAVNELVLTLNFGGSGGPTAASVILSTTVGGSSSFGGSSGLTLNTGVEHTMVVTVTGSSFEVVIDLAGLIFTTVPTGIGTGILISQQGGSAGDVVFNEVKVTA
jgi:hypothetical protein